MNATSAGGRTGPRRTTMFVLGVLAVAMYLVTAVPMLVAAGERVVLETELGPLVGTLEMPAAEPAAVVLMISGSGPTDRDGNSTALAGDNNSLRYLAEALREAGIASLRFDKRLVGESRSTALTEADLRFDTYVEDAVAWAEHLTEKVPVPLFILGHSEGALIATLSAQRVEPEGCIVVAGPGRRASDLISGQLQDKLPPALLTRSESILDSLDAGLTVASPPPVLNSLFRPSVQPYLISWFRYDPAEELAKLEMPVLLIYGTTDLQVPVPEGELLRAARPETELVVVTGMNHVLKMVDGSLGEQMPSYSDPELPVSQELIDAVIGFIE